MHLEELTGVSLCRIWVQPLVGTWVHPSLATLVLSCPSPNRWPIGERTDASEQMAGIQEQIKAIQNTNERIHEQSMRYESARTADG